MAIGVKTGGRKAGTPNKTTALLKDAVLQAASQAHPDGLIGYLQKQAAENPAPFMALLGKVLPMQIAGDKDNPLKLEASIARDSVIGLLERIAAGRSGDDRGPREVAGPREG